MEDLGILAVLHIVDHVGLQVDHETTGHVLHTASLFVEAQEVHRLFVARAVGLRT